MVLLSSAKSYPMAKMLVSSANMIRGNALQIVNIQDKQERSQHRDLGDTAFNCYVKSREPD